VVTPVVFRATVRHTRVHPWVRAFSYRYPVWLVDLDHVPRLPRTLRPLLRFDAGDHLGDPGATIRENVDRFCEARGLPASDRVLMLANPRSFGHCFNPLTVYWCYRAGDGGDGAPGGPASGSQWLHAVVAEVQNTYGERHCYLLRPDASGRAGVDKALYVSPFFPVDGRYEMQFTEPDDRLDLRIALRRHDATVFRASLTAGRPDPVRSAVTAALRHPLPGWWVSARIRAQGVRLWLRRLPVMNRPAHVHQELV
jgi:DUF1365 family protein